MRAPSISVVAVPCSGWKFGAKKTSTPAADRIVATFSSSPANEEAKTLLSTMSCAGLLAYCAILAPTVAAPEDGEYQLKSKEIKTFMPLLSADS